MGWFSRQPARVTRVATPPGAVPRATTTLMQQRGWQKTWAGWVGPYATRYGTWQGKIEKAGDTFRVFIRNPPPEIHSHPKWACFHRHKGDWYRIHLHTAPIDRDPNAVVRYCEEILTTSFKR